MSIPDPNLDHAVHFLESIRGRRSVREFSDRPVSQAVIEHLIASAGSAPSGANKQPWRFIAVQDPALKREIREAAEEEERKLYDGRANPDWLEDLAPLGTNAQKPFLETAPWLVIVFKQVRNTDPERGSEQVYYVNESVGIAVGMFLAAAQCAGLATLTHTPSPMKFLAGILGRPEHERPFMVIPVGHPAEGSTLPDIRRKSLDVIMRVDRDRSPNEDDPDRSLPSSMPPTIDG
ncbi:MAG: nitroreductase family protein [Planctomycetota bacterium]